MKPLNQFGELQVTEFGRPTQTLPTYTCGHCSDVVVMREDRERARNLCLACHRWICEKKQICNAGCTPLNGLAEDHFETKTGFGRFANAIMAGVQTVDEGIEKGLITL